MKLTLTIISVILIFAGCTKHSIHNEETQFIEGKKLYISKCGGCHKLYVRNEFTPAQWDTIVVSMRNKAKITADQENEILKFLKER
ncbi:MAG: hypothetical protein WHV63_00105 [Ignavibacteria bacterium]|jgi:hypothetical protein|nr:hypothetical protein [Ignavibacteria bacterium]MDH7528444.1 hypothetical protein [Ignavibacteria bacterium]